jgi:hypothetical protein
MSTLVLSKLFKMSSNSVLKISRDLLLERMKKFLDVLRLSIREILIAWILPAEIIFASILVGSFIGWTMLQFIFIVLGFEKLLEVFEFKRLK